MNSWKLDKTRGRSRNRSTAGQSVEEHPARYHPIPFRFCSARARFTSPGLTNFPAMSFLLQRQSSLYSACAIGFAFQNILQNSLAGLLLLWAEPFRIGDEIKLDNYEGSVLEIQTRATIIKTYDGRQIVIPNADLSRTP